MKRMLYTVILLIVVTLFMFSVLTPLLNLNDMKTAIMIFIQSAMNLVG